MSSGHQRIKWRRNIAENFNRLSRVHERYRQTTDDRRQTDRQTTDRRTTTYSEREHEFTFAKNGAGLVFLDHVVGYDIDPLDAENVRRPIMCLRQLRCNFEVWATPLQKTLCILSRSRDNRC